MKCPANRGPNVENIADGSKDSHNNANAGIVIQNKDRQNSGQTHQEVSQISEQGGARVEPANNCAFDHDEILTCVLNEWYSSRNASVYTMSNSTNSWESNFEVMQNYICLSRLSFDMFLRKPKEYGLGMGVFKARFYLQYFILLEYFR